MPAASPNEWDRGALPCMVGELFQRRTCEPSETRSIDRGNRELSNLAEKLGTRPKRRPRTGRNFRRAKRRGALSGRSGRSAHSPDRPDGYAKHRQRSNGRSSARDLAPRQRRYETERARCSTRFSHSSARAISNPSCSSGSKWPALSSTAKVACGNSAIIFHASR